MRLPRAARPGTYMLRAQAITRTGWFLLVLGAGRQGRTWLGTVRFAAGDVGHDLVVPPPPRFMPVGARTQAIFLRSGTYDVSAALYGAPRPPDEVTLRVIPVPPTVAALSVLAQQPVTVRRAFGAVAGPWPTRLRKAVALASVHGPKMRSSYLEWLALFDSRPAEAAPPGPAVHALVWSAAGEGPALAATLAGLQAQSRPLGGTTVLRPGDPLPDLDAPWVLLLQAGEVLAPDAVLRLAEAMPEDGGGAVLADEDGVDPDGSHRDPWFKPEPSLLTACSGLLSRGAWLVDAALTAGTPQWAEEARLLALFRLHVAGEAARARRVPLLLTRRRWDTESAPGAVLAAVVDAALSRMGVAAEAVPGEVPLRLSWRPSAINEERVSVIVPSRLRGETQLACMTDILRRTAHRNVEMVVVVTQPGELDAAQTEAARRLEATGRARVAVLHRDGFNYSHANNFGAGLTDAAVLCLLNDDVSTLEPDWLDMLVARLSVPKVGIVGARLYYPNGVTQHGGVLMGLAGLAEHMNRFLPRGEAGYMGRGALDQELSAVTGACLLVRRDAFAAVGGLDEDLPTGFNDVDFCLRVGAAGWSVVMAAPVELLHHETLSFGHHYAGATAREAADIRFMRDRWGAATTADPFHNPNLSVVPSSEWQLAYPPRHRWAGGAG